MNLRRKLTFWVLPFFSFCFVSSPSIAGVKVPLPSSEWQRHPRIIASRNLVQKIQNEEKRQPADFWIGRYIFGEDGGTTPTGVVVYVTHTLLVEKRNGALVSTLRSEGFQTSREIFGKAIIKGDRLQILFQKENSDSSSEELARNDPLFTLERIQRGQSLEILTHWGKFKGSLQSQPSGRVSFQKET